MGSNGSEPYNILSLDGGGSWALIEVMALQAIFGDDARGHEVLQHFNLVAANSGGSIVLGGLAANWTLTDILGMFYNQADRTQIFVNLGLQSDLARVIGFGPQYSTERKLQGLQALLPQANDIFSDVWANTGNEPNPPDILIPAFDYDRQRATFFRSNLNSAAAGFPRPGPVNLLEAINASSTAPVNYFDVPAVVNGNRYWDGGVGGFNNPVFAGVVEAMSNGVPRENIQALSIGTGGVFLPIQNAQNPIPAGLAQDPYQTGWTLPNEIHDLKELATSILDDPPDAASFDSHVALGQRLPRNPGDVVADGTVVRMNPMIQPIYNSRTEQWTCPADLSMDDFTKLVNLSMDAVAQDSVDAIMRLTMGWLNGSVPNQPIRQNPQDFSAEIGHLWFPDAKAAWQKLQGVEPFGKLTKVRKTRRRPPRRTKRRKKSY